VMFALNPDFAFECVHTHPINYKSASSRELVVNGFVFYRSVKISDLADGKDR
jgi:hypothetical protein